MRQVLAEVGNEVAWLQSRVASAPARHRFALAGLALAIAAGVLAPLVAARAGVSVEAALVAVLSVGFVALGWSVGRQVDRLTESSLEDPMTRVGNRRHWEERLTEEVDRAARSRMPLSLLLLDVDNLKKMNDQHGHQLGDRALAMVGDVLRETCRSRDFAARIGGDEFAILLPRTRSSEAKVVAERVRSALARRRIRAGAPLDALLTVSIGIADIDSVPNPTTELLFETADRALYASKQGGRDRIEVKEAQCNSGIIVLDERRAARKKKKDVATAGRP